MSPDVVLNKARCIVADAILIGLRPTEVSTPGFGASEEPASVKIREPKRHGIDYGVDAG